MGSFSSLHLILVATAAFSTWLGRNSLLVSAAGTNLGGGIMTTTDVRSWADLPQDIDQIDKLLKQNLQGSALSVYRDGQNSQMSSGLKRSLKSLGVDLSQANPKTPSFLYHLYGQTGRSLNLAFDRTKTEYINNEVEEYLQSKPSVAVTAIWALNLWMYSTHLLFNGVYECDQRSLADNPAVFDLQSAGWDQFIAMYIGDRQSPARTDGFSLYKWAQELGNVLGTSSPEANVNTRIKLIYQEASTILNVQGACTRNNPQTAGKLFVLASQAVAELSKPLFQGLIKSIKEDDRDLIQVYARALVPQIAKCRPSTYKTFYESLIINEYAGDPTTLFNLIPDATYCFGYSCEELGNTGIDQCVNFDERRPVLSGYIPSTPVGNVAKADLDVYQLKILAELKAYNFAKYLYMYGSNINKYRMGDGPIEYVSLHDIAVTSERSNAKKWFDMFVSYNNDKDYADKAIRQVLDGVSNWQATQQIASIIATTAAFQILFFEAMSKLEIAVNECRDADPELGPMFVLNPIDEAAALLIGTMEGDKIGGSSDLEDGQLIYNINNKHAFQFGTINEFRYAKSVSVVGDLLFAAKAELDALDCDDLESSTGDILRFSMIGVIQASIFLASKNDQLDAFSNSDSLAEAEGLALSVLPIIHNNDPVVAKSLRENSIRTPGAIPVPDGAAQVAKWWGKGFVEAMEMDCVNLGSISGVKPCDGPWGSVSYGRAHAPKKSSATSAAMWLAGAFAAVSGTVCVLAVL